MNNYFSVHINLIWTKLLGIEIYFHLVIEFRIRQNSDQKPRKDRKPKYRTNYVRPYRFLKLKPCQNKYKMRNLNNFKINMNKKNYNNN